VQLDSRGKWFDRTKDFLQLVDLNLDRTLRIEGVGFGISKIVREFAISICGEDFFFENEIRVKNEVKKCGLGMRQYRSHWLERYFSDIESSYGPANYGATLYELELKGFRESNAGLYKQKILEAESAIKNEKKNECDRVGFAIGNKKQLVEIVSEVVAKFGLVYDGSYSGSTVFSKRIDDGLNFLLLICLEAESPSERNGSGNVEMFMGFATCQKTQNLIGNFESSCVFPLSYFIDYEHQPFGELYQYYQSGDELLLNVSCWLTVFETVIQDFREIKGVDCWI
jgi:hypothetical protein